MNTNETQLTELHVHLHVHVINHIPVTGELGGNVDRPGIDCNS